MGFLLSVVNLDDEQNKAPGLAWAAKSSNPTAAGRFMRCPGRVLEMLTYPLNGPLWSGVQGTRKFDEGKKGKKEKKLISKITLGNKNFISML